MVRAAMLLGLLGSMVACTSAAPPREDVQAETPDAPAPVEPAPVAPVGEVADTPEPEPEPALFYGDDELRELGLRVERLSDALAVVCPPDDDVYCECIEALDCGGEPCITLERNLEIFREALARKTGATVHCEAAQTGTCAGDGTALTYFDFNGDIHRHELRFFADDGGERRLVAMRNSTDYNQYCDGKAMTRWLGGIPKCEAMTLGETICGDVDGPPAGPKRRIEILLDR